MKKLLLSILLLTCLTKCHTVSTKDTKSPLNTVYQQHINEMNYMFASEESFLHTVDKLSEVYNVDFNKSKNLKELNEKMQKTLIRQRGVERFDRKNDNTDFDVNKIYNTKFNIENYQKNEQDKLVILGATYETMKKIITNAEYLLKEKEFLILTGDRPFVPEDFNLTSKDYAFEKIIQSLEQKNHKYKVHRKEVKKIITEFLKQKDKNPLERFKFYVKLINLVNKNDGNIADRKIKNLESNLKKYGMANKEFVTSFVEVKIFLYEVAVKKYIPTETDLAFQVCKERKLSKYKVIEAKTRYKVQDRATTVDTYNELIRHYDDNKVDKNGIVLVGIKPYIYRQWLDFVYLAKFKPRYIAIENKNISNSNFSDDFARMIFVLNSSNNLNFEH